MNHLLLYIFLIIPTALSPFAHRDTVNYVVTPLADLQYTRDSINNLRLSALEAQQIISKAEEYLGYPYRYGAKGPKAFDCSGFTSFIFKQFGHNLSSSSREQIKDGRKVPEGLEYLQKGDILIFGRRGNPSAEGHAAIFIDIAEDGTTGRFIHADRKGVRISRMDEPYYQNRFIGARRILPDFGDTPVPPADTTAAENVVEKKEKSEAVFYSIKKGDNLYDIARHNHTTVEKLCRLNNLSRKSTLHIGQKIQLR